MTEYAYNVFAAVGICLTFIASIAGVIVSVISLRTSKRTAVHTNYLSSITASREKWSYALRESASNYFTQVARLCSMKEDNLTEIVNELTKYHFAIVLLLFEQDKKLHDNMSIIRSKSFEIAYQEKMIQHQYEKVKDSGTPDMIGKMDIVVNAREVILDLIKSIDKVKNEVFDEIVFLLEREWRRQQFEARESGSWNYKQNNMEATELWNDNANG